jgi:hypothetical protein
MKNLIAKKYLFFCLCSGVLFVGLGASSLGSIEARDMSYKFGFGFKQVYSNGFVNKNDAESGSIQLNGLNVSYGLARDFQVDVSFAVNRNFDSFILGPGIRYDIQRLLSESLAAWNYLNIFVQASFFIKSGDKVKTGVLVHAPYLGFELLPFEANDFAVQASAGLAFDFLKKNRFGFTQGMFGDVGLKYYF